MLISIMSCPDADLIAVSLACPKDHMIWGLLVSSVRKLLEKVGDLRALQFWSNQFWHFWHLLVNTKPGQIVSDYHPLILGLMYICFLKKFEIIFECLCMWSVSYSQGAMFSDKLMNLFILGMNFGQNIHNTILLKPEKPGLKILLWHKMM